MMAAQELSKEIVQILKDYFACEDRVVMAFIFGSWARGKAGGDSDVDVAIYLSPDACRDKKEQGFPTAEQTIWADVERIVGREVDLVVLNDASAAVAGRALKGNPIAIKDQEIYLAFLLRVTSEATDFQEWVESYWAPRQNVC